MPDNEFEGSPRNWPPLGLPTGSVRALLTLIVLAVVLTNLAWGRKVDELWVQTLLIALAHYFTTRRFIALPRDVLERLEQEGVLEKERHPLFLPKNSIRAMILGSFVALAVYLFLYHQDRLFGPNLTQLTQAMTLLCIVFAYLLGGLVGGIGSWFRGGRIERSAGTWGDLKALIVLIVLILAAIPEFLDQPHNLPPVVHQIALGLMLFYYGSR